jgi:hypothetical protein
METARAARARSSAVCTAALHSTLSGVLGHSGCSSEVARPRCCCWELAWPVSARGRASYSGGAQQVERLESRRFDVRSTWCVRAMLAVAGEQARGTPARPRDFLPPTRRERDDRTRELKRQKNNLTNTYDYDTHFGHLKSCVSALKMPIHRVEQNINFSFDYSQNTGSFRHNVR